MFRHHIDSSATESHLPYSAITLNLLEEPASLPETQSPPSWSQKALCSLRSGVQMVSTPATFLASKIALSTGLGIQAQSRLVDGDKRQELMDRGGEQVLFSIAGQPALEGMFFHAKNADPHAKTILLCTEGSFSYEHDALPMVCALKSMGQHIFLFNYEGFGNSEGVASAEGAYRSAEAAYQYLKQQKKCTDETIVAWGRGLGVDSVFELVFRHNLDAFLEWESPSMHEESYQRFLWGSKNTAHSVFSQRSLFDRLEHLERVRGRLFIVNKETDDEKHRELLKEGISQHPHALLKTVPAHSKENQQAWFAEGENRTVVQLFLSCPYSTI